MRVIGQVSDEHGRALRNVFEVDLADLIEEIPPGTADPEDGIVLQDSVTHELFTVAVSDLITSGGGITGGLNVGAGAQVFKDVLGNDLRFRTLLGGSGISLSTGVDDITIDVVAGLIDHGGLAGLLDDDHPQYGALAQNETVVGSWTFSATTTTSNLVPIAFPGAVDIGTNFMPYSSLFLSAINIFDLGTGVFEGSMISAGGNIIAAVTNTLNLTATSIDLLAPLHVLTNGIDEIQLQVKGVAAQAADIFVVESSAGADLLTASLTSVRSITHTPVADATSALGTTALRWTNLFLSGSILDSSSAQIYVRRSGADTMTGFWNIGSNKLGVNSAATTGNVNVAVSGTGTPGIFFVIGGSTSEEIMNSIDGGGFGWVWSLDNSADGDFRLKTNTAKTQRYRFYRDSNRFHIGSSAAVTALGSEALTVEGLVRATKGASFNTGGGSTDPDNWFKVIDSAGGGNYAMVVNPTVSTGGVGFFTNSLPAILNFTAGLVSASKAGLGIVLQTATDNLTEWYSSDVFSNAAFGFGWISENSATGDRVFFAKNGSATNSVVLYAKRSNQFVGIGATFSLGGTVPSSQLHVGGTFAVDSTSIFADDITLNTGTDLVLATSGAGTKIGTGTTQLLGFWNKTPVVQYSTTGTLTGFTANTTTPVLDGSTFTGNTGATAYTIGDIVRALKLCGIMLA